MNRNEGHFQRMELLVGNEGIEKLNNTRIAVVGVGGVGSYAVEALCRCGVGSISIIDPDRIEESNINRQVPALSSTIGCYKTEVMAARMLDINPAVRVTQYPCRYSSTNNSMIDQGNFDYVIDAIDSLEDKINLIKTCLDKNIPIISSMGTANRVNPLMLEIADIQETSGCPVARRVRRELKRNNIITGLTVVYSREIPLKKGTDLGSVVYVTAAAGMLLAGFTVNSILGINI